MKNLIIDLSGFQKKFKHITETKIPGLINKGLGQAGMQLLRDTVMERPTVPMKEGTLRGSGSIFVDNKLVQVSPFGKKGKAAGSCSGMKKDMAMVVFNTEYAARLHEAEGFKFTEPSSGPKYLESKMIRYGKGYFKLIANIIKGGR